jgi:hypothetical protein
MLLGNRFRRNHVKLRPVFSLPTTQLIAVVNPNLLIFSGEGYDQRIWWAAQLRFITHVRILESFLSYDPAASMDCITSLIPGALAPSVPVQTA